MVRATIDEIQRDLRGCLKRVQAGETVVVVDSDEPVAEIKPVRTNGDAERPWGLCATEFQVPDSFDEPLPDDVITGFEGR